MKKNNKRNLGIVNVTWYEEEAYFKCFPNATVEDYLKSTDEYNLKDVIKLNEKHYNARIEGFRRVVIDDAYFASLELNDIKDSSEARTSFVNSVDDEYAETLWANSVFGSDVELWAVPISVMSDGMLHHKNYDLSSNDIDKIKSLLKKHFNIEDRSVYVNEKLYRADYLCEITDEIEKQFLHELLGEESIEIASKILDDKYSKCSKSNLCIRYLVIGFEKETNCKISRDEVYAIHNECYEKYSIESITQELLEILETSVLSFLKNKACISIMPLPVLLSDVAEATIMIENSLISELKESGLQVN